MEKILVLGSLNMDLVTTVEKTPLVGQTILGNGFEKIEGGKGANQAVAIAKLGGDVKMLGMLGDDEFAQRLRDSLRANNVDIQYLMKDENTATGTALILVNADGNNSIVVIAGANHKLTSDKLKAEHFEDIDYLLAQLEVPVDTIATAFAKAKQQQIKTVLNPAPALELPKELLANTDLIVPNQTEFELLTGFSADNQENLIKGCDKLFALGVKEVLVTLGEEGAFYFNAEGVSYKKSAYRVKAIDTTAAGDSFIGGLMAKLASGSDMESAIDYAMKVAALSVTKKGAQTSIPSLADVENFK